ncbi:MAG TPA: hypothetical protein VIQ54_21000 [Polyangia bacterium]
MSQAEIDAIAELVRRKLGEDFERERAEWRAALEKANEAARKAEAAAKQAEKAKVLIEAEEVGSANTVVNPGPPPDDFAARMARAGQDEATRVRQQQQAEADRRAAANGFRNHGSEG